MAIFSTGQQVTASDMNDISTLRGSRAVETSGTQSIANGATDKITFTSETFDPQTELASSTFTAEAAGYYLVIAGVIWLTNGDNISVTTSVYKNGASYAAQTLVADTGQTFVATQVVTVVNLAATDTVEVYGTHSHTSAVSVTRLAGGVHRFEVIRLFKE